MPVYDQNSHDGFFKYSSSSDGVHKNFFAKLLVGIFQLESAKKSWYRMSK